MSEQPVDNSKRRKRLLEGRSVIWPGGLEERLGIAPQTRWRWEKEGRLPKRDFFVDGRPVGWKPETIEAATKGNQT